MDTLLKAEVGFVPGMLVFAVTVEVARVVWAVMVIV